METRSIAKRRKVVKLPTASFKDLPDEIILQIFKHLDFFANASASQACKRWKLLSEDQSLWQKINLTGREVPGKFIEKALKHGCQYLGLCGTKITNELGCEFSASNQLKYLSISCDNYFESHHEVLMENLLGATQFLKKLSIQCDREYAFHFQPNIIQNNQTLTVLQIKAFKSLTLETVKLIFTNCLELTEVSLTDCSMSVEALSFMCNNLTSKIKKLCLFRLSAFDSEEDYILEDEHIIAITNRCPQLEELDLGGQENFISEVALFTIIEKLQNLVKLKLPNTGQIRFPKLLELRSMPNLKYLRIHVKLVDFSPRDFLRNLTASGPESMPDQFDALARETTLIKELVKNLPNLKINEGEFEIADPDLRFLCYERLWEIQCKPSVEFYEDMF